MDFSNFIAVDSKAIDIADSTKGKELVDPKVMQSLIDRGLKVSEIAKELGLTPRQVTVYKNHRGMKSARTSRLILTPEEEQVVISSIIGDGCIEINNKERGYCRLSIKHGEAQEDYIKWKHSLISRFAAVSSRFVIDNRPKFKNRTEFNLRTTTNEIFKEYREIFYPNGKKIAPLNELRKIKNLGLAIWFMDDGYKQGNTLFLSLNGFDSQSLTNIQTFFEELGIITTIQNSGILRFSVKTVDNYLALIKPFIHPTLEYKVRLKSGEFMEHPEEDNHEPS